MKEQIHYDISIEIERKKDKVFRYKYTKTWDSKKKKIIAILFNPSKATLTYNDRTVDFLTDFFNSKEYRKRYNLPEYGGIVILNLFSYMSPNQKNLINTVKEYEDKNCKLINEFLDANKDCDYYFGWGKDFKSIKNNLDKYMEDNKIPNSKKKIITAELDTLIKEADKRKYCIERFFVENDMKSKVRCFYSKTKDKKVNKCLHPSKYKESWIYSEYFQNYLKLKS